MVSGPTNHSSADVLGRLTVGNRHGEWKYSHSPCTASGARLEQTRGHSSLPAVAVAGAVAVVVVVSVAIAIAVIVVAVITILIACDNVRDTAIDRAVGGTLDRTESLLGHLARKGGGGHFVSDFHDTVRIRAGVTEVLLVEV